MFIRLKPQHFGPAYFWLRLRAKLTTRTLPAIQPTHGVVCRPAHFLEVGGAPFAEGLDAFCFSGPAFFGFRISLLPFAMFASFAHLGWFNG